MSPLCMIWQGAPIGSSADFSINKNAETKICIIVVQFLKYYLKSHLIYTIYINDAIIDKQSSINQISLYLT